jgi:hypothetical protein
MATRNEENDMSGTTTADRRGYEPPKLTVLGKTEALTLSPHGAASTVVFPHHGSL